MLTEAQHPHPEIVQVLRQASWDLFRATVTTRPKGNHQGHHQHRQDGLGELCRLFFADLGEVAVYCPECGEREFGED